MHQICKNTGQIGLFLVDLCGRRSNFFSKELQSVYEF